MRNSEKNLRTYSSSRSSTYLVPFSRYWDEKARK